MSGKVILRLMGCESVQFGSMERYLVRVAAEARRRGDRVVVAYDAEPAVPAFREALEAAGGRLVVLGLAGRGVPRFWRDLHRLVEDEGVSVLHAYFTPACHYALMYAWARRMPVRVRTSANMPWTTNVQADRTGALFRTRFAATQRSLAVFPQAILVLSEAMRDEFLGLGVPDGKLVVVEGGVDDGVFTPDDQEGRERVRAELQVPADVVAVGSCARLVPVKGLEHLVAAASLLDGTMPSVRVFIAGDGPLRRELEESAAPNTILTAHRQDVPDFLAALDVFVLPSFSEGLSNSLMEAMACGLPCVVTDTAPNRTLVEDGANGVVVPMRDAAALAAAIGRLARDRGLRERLGAAARETIVGRFTVARRVAREQDLYERLGS